MASSYTLITLPEFLDDLRAMERFYRARDNQTAPEKIRSELTSLLERLKSSPRFGAPWQPTEGIDTSYRSAVVHEHRVTYRVLDRQRTVVVSALIPTAFGEERTRERVSDR